MLAGSEAVLQFTRQWHVAGCMQNFGSSAGQAVKSIACCNAFGSLLFNKSTCAGEELADVLLYLVRLSDACGIDLAAAAEAKLRKNAGKFFAGAWHGMWQLQLRRLLCHHGGFRAGLRLH